MTLDLFKSWLHSLDDSLNNKSLLLIDSCGAHGKPDNKDPLLGETWKHLRIERIISAFKRHYLEMLSDKSITKEYATGKMITNGEAWSLIPYAWSHVKALTARHYFCKAGVLTKAQVDKLNKGSMHVEERPPLYPPTTGKDASQVRRRYVRLIASVMDGDMIQFALDKNQKDAQDVAEGIKRRMLSKIAKRYSPRNRSSSIEPDIIESFKSKYEGNGLATEMVEMLTGEDARGRKAARQLIRLKSKQK
ncbi:MAG: hypothetical protein JOS17DRAFT_756331 [Linnemannia elongata]|nr:MAG: hypothetical protein JOS17DRAFT_756331 [Linnemannia elongata]